MIYSDVLDLVVVLCVISVAVERCNEILINGLKLDAKISDAKSRKFFYQLMSAATGSMVYLLNIDTHSELLGMYFSEYMQCAIVGLLVSAGSGFWHDMLKFLTGLSTQQKKTVVE